MTSRVPLLLNLVTGEAQWHKPRILGSRDDCPMAEPDITKPSPRHQSLSSRTPRTVRIPENEGDAALIIQGLARRKIARRRVIERTTQTFEKLYDDESGAFYYWNLVTGEAQWHKPRILGSRDDCPWLSLMVSIVTSYLPSEFEFEFG